MIITLSTPSTVKDIAQNYTPDALPPTAILRDWLKLSNSKVTMSELTENLKSGKAFMFAEGSMILWRNEDE